MACAVSEFQFFSEFQFYFNRVIRQIKTFNNIKHKFINYITIYNLRNIEDINYFKNREIKSGYTEYKGLKGEILFMYSKYINKHIDNKTDIDIIAFRQIIRGDLKTIYKYNRCDCGDC